ncbi:Putative uncharacterized protein [Pseudomonas aeruginosa]|nr:hypothetical protein PA2G_04052 [Pseudomonas aeruginosa 2192]CEI75455.1 Putative uncharacterized protein [Pseudomonas aeruginosa]
MKGGRSARDRPPERLAANAAGAVLDLADQVQGRSEGLLAFLPLGRADFARVGGGVLGGLQLAHGLADVTGDLVGVDLDGLDHAFRVDHEGTAQGQAFFRDVHAEGVGQLVGRVADQRELGLADCRGGFVPDLVREVGVGGHDVDLGTGFLELAVVVGGVFDLGRAVEGEGSRHEDQDRPLALQGFLGHLDELAVVESVDLERLDLSVDQGHQSFLSQLNGVFQIDWENLNGVRQKCPIDLGHQ